jgi:hypothetical protein
MKIQQTITARLLPSAFKPLKHGLILGVAILFPAAGAFSQEVAAWPFATDSGKPTAPGAPVLSAESTPANEWPLTTAPKETTSSLVYKASVYESASKYPLMVAFTDVKPELRTHLENPGFNGLVGKKSWRIDMEVTFASVSAAFLLELGGKERESLRMTKEFRGGLRINQLGHYDARIKSVELEPNKTYKISLVKQGKKLSVEINGLSNTVSSRSPAITSPGISIGGPANVSYATPVGSISAIRIESTEVAQ